MPELPEVERARSLADLVGRGRRVEKVWCAGDRIVFDGVTPARFRRALSGARIEEVHRRGKHFWLQLDRPLHPLFHLGMTGALLTPKSAPLRLASSPKRPDAEWPPRFRKLHLWLDDGEELVFTNKRRLGRLRLRREPLREPPISELGFDPLLDSPTPREFAGMLFRRSVTMKGLLLDQSFAAGVGNWIADEVLYQARIDPRRRASSLSSREAERVRTRLRSVVHRAVAADAEHGRFPKTWLFHSRWGKDPKARTARGEKIEFLTVGGRTTAWVPGVQR